MGKESLVKQLQNPAIYPDSPEKIEFTQTHISYIFLTSKFVYKVKKSVNFGFLDYSSLEKRKFYCEEEIRLNKRLCPDIYLGVIEIKENKGRISLGGRGRVIEYAVEMRQLPQEGMMDNLITAKKVTKRMVEKVASRIADFHAKAKTGEEVNKYGRLPVIRKNIDENFDQTKNFVDIALAKKRYDEIKHYSYRFLKEHRSLIKRRVEEGRIKDCHGDLYSRNICFSGDDVYIYDCIEFNKRFRYSDVAAEVAFLAMDLDFYGREDLSDCFVESYVKCSGDEELPKLLDFYKCYRAYVRGKVHCFSLPRSVLLDIGELGRAAGRRQADLDKKKARGGENATQLSRAKKYFRLAHRYTGSKSIPALVAIGGLTGTGKTSVAYYLRDKFNFPVISSDIVRKRIADVPPSEHRLEKFGDGIYSEEFTERTYNTIFENAKGYLERGSSVILDATFGSRQGRKKAMDAAKGCGADFIFVECICNEEETRKRLSHRLKDKKAVSDGRWEIYARQKQIFDKVNEIPLKNHIVVDTSKPFRKKLSSISMKF